MDKNVSNAANQITVQYVFNDLCAQRRMPILFHGVGCHMQPMLFHCIASLCCVPNVVEPFVSLGATATVCQVLQKHCFSPSHCMPNANTNHDLFCEPSSRCGLDPYGSVWLGLIIRSSMAWPRVASQNDLASNNASPAQSMAHLLCSASQTKPK